MSHARGAVRAEKEGRRFSGAAFLPILCAVASAFAGVATAQSGGDVAVLEDVVDIQVIGRELRGYVSGGGGSPLRLEQGEKVWRSESRGRVGIVLTNRRFLGISPGSGGWRENARRLSEGRDPLWSVAGRLALVVTGKRALVFDSVGGGWLEEEIGPHERVLDVGTGQGVAALVTDRRAIAFLPGGARFQEIKLRVGEELVELRTLSDFARLRTAERLLVFRGGAGSWSEESLPLNDGD